MTLPSDPEPTRAKRLPWLTFALLAALVAAFLVARGEQGFVGDGAEVNLDAAVELWLTHPYLTPDPALLAALPAERVSAARDEGERASVHPDSRAEEQAELDYVTRLALRGSDSRPGPTHPFRRFGWTPAEKRAPSLLGHAALHSGYVHLAVVLALLWLAGPALERVYGRRLFTAVCLGSCLAAAGAYALAEAESRAPLVGAWGLASGAAGALGVRFAGERVSLGWKSLAAPGWVAWPAWLGGGAVLYLVTRGPDVATGESLAPNLAGLAAGVALAFAAKALRIEERRAAREAEARMIAHLDPRVREALDAHRRGSYDHAIAVATPVLRERPDDTDALLAIWNAHVAAGHESRGLATAKRLIEVYARHGDLASAARVWGELIRAQPDMRLEPTVLLRIVPELVIQARRDAAIAALRCVTAPESQRALTVGQAVRAAELAAELDPPCALAATRFALSQPDLAGDKRERLVALARELEGKTGATAVPALPPVDPGALDGPPSESLVPTPVPELELESTSHPPTVPTMVFADQPSPGVPPTIAAPAPLPPAPPTPLTAPRPEPAAVKLVPAVPLALDPGGLRMRIDGAAPAVLAWERVQAVGVGLVAGLAPKPIVVIDLALNWADAGSGALEVLRMRSDSFRARALVGGEGSALEALRALLAQLLARSGAVPLPDGGSARGLPFREFPDPSSYERDVLLQES